MKFRTEIIPETQSERISYSTPAMFVGSCFAGEMAGKMKEGLMPVLSNPFGVVYNPSSVAIALRHIISDKLFSEEDLWFFNDKWISFAHYTDFSSEDRNDCLSRINRMKDEARNFLMNASFLFVTFGTARVFRRADTGEVVSNCHKMPSSFFTRELLSVNSITNDWSTLLDDLYQFNPRLSVVFTVSPVRHWKDGYHGNQVSKSVLILAVEDLLRHKTKPGYFPSYEIMMDDLRDYRFYGVDMLHPSEEAVEYIREKFYEAFFDVLALKLWEEVSAVYIASRHRIMSGSERDVTKFAGLMIERIVKLGLKAPQIDFSELRRHFEQLMKPGISE